MDLTTRSEYSQLRLQLVPSRKGGRRDFKGDVSLDPVSLLWAFDNGEQSRSETSLACRYRAETNLRQRNRVARR